ncbi:hypothetical protein EJ07DRAFT_160145 [Lizonia empirigonia]|nr:hypothetical protein EJ07DRAFT_160145 [Lizonia empirigonia]
MKLTTIFLTIGTLAATAAASSPLPSYANIHINIAPATAISKSRVSSTFAAREPLALDSQANTAIEALSHAIRDASARASRFNGMGRRTPEPRQSAYLSRPIRGASTDTLKSQSGLRGMSVRSRTAREAEFSNSKTQRQSADVSSQRRAADGEAQAPRRGMGKTRKQ